MNNKIDQNTINEIRDYVLGLFQEHLSEKLIYHSNGHTIDVLESATEIAEKSGVDGHRLGLIKIAALFHDAGYIHSYEDHEMHSAGLAREFLTSKGFPREDVNIVCDAILATSIPQQPGDLVAEILCDADLIHLASADYFEKVEPIRQEWVNIGKANLNEFEFLKTSLAFFDSHRYQSPYGKEKLAPLKAINRRRISEKLASMGYNA